MEIKLEISTDKPAEEVSKIIGKQLGLELYKSGKYSLKYCIECLGLTYGEFFQVLSENKVGIRAEEDPLVDFKQKLNPPKIHPRV